MHRFLRAVGFSRIKERKDLDNLLGRIMNQPDKKNQILISPGKTYTEFSAYFTSNTGIRICGEYDKKGFFFMEHYYPFCESRLVTSTEDVTVNKRVDTNAFTGMCDDPRHGISMIFYLQNAIDYLAMRSADNLPHKATLTLSGLSLKGSILLGVYHTPETVERRQRQAGKRNHLISLAKNGDQKAIDDLTLEEFDQTSRIRNRFLYQDLYSLVETTFIPYGSESDHYSILGTIINWSFLENSVSKECVYQLILDCNSIWIAVCINAKDLLGEPMVGRRFKGVIWMQGHADFLKKT